MATPIEQYAFLGDRHGSALVSSTGSIDWLCLPDFDSAACMASLLGTEEHGRWLLAPLQQDAVPERHYLPDSLVLESTWRCDDAVVRVREFMPTGDRRADLIRRVECLEGHVTMRHEWSVRPWYGLRQPLVSRRSLDGLDVLVAVDGPDTFVLRGPGLPDPEPSGTMSTQFDMSAGDCWEFDLVWQPSTEPLLGSRTEKDWLGRVLDDSRQWLEQCSYQGPWRDQVRTSLVVLRHLTHERTGRAPP